MRIIDFHTHIYPDPLARKGSRSICEFYDLQSDLDGSAQALLTEGKKVGIEAFVLLPVSIKPEHVRSINRFTAEEVKNHKEFIGFGTIHPAMEHLTDELAEIETLGLKGVKIHPDTQRFPMDDERMYPVYDALQGRMPILIHCGDPRYDYSHPQRLKKILREFPRLTVIAAHLGGWSVFDTAFACLKDENCFVDISSSMMFLSKEQMEYYIAGYGADRVLFGSDFPLWSPAQEVESFLKLNLTQEEREKIAYRNALRILGEKLPE